MMRALFLVFFLSPLLSLHAQSTVHLGGMTWSCIQHNDSLIMELRAPTNGWVGVRFNRKNNIVDSDLLLFRVKEDQLTFQDMYVKGVGRPVLDQQLGGRSDVEILAYEETKTHTIIRFRRPYVVNDRYDYQLVPDEEFWLILAYSVDDDFGHHSRMRQHQKVIFKPE